MSDRFRGSAVVVLAPVVAVALGLLALLADAVPGPLGKLLIVVASTGLSWGGAAFVFGAKSPTRLLAAVTGTIVTVGAVATYYGAANLVSARQTATSRSLLAAGQVWGAVAAVAGPVLGLLGWYAVRTTGRSRTAAWGALGGLLLSQGLYLLFRTSGGLLDAEAGALRPLLAVGLLVPVALVIAGSRRKFLPLGFSVMLGVGIIGALVWSLIMKAV